MSLGIQFRSLPGLTPYEAARELQLKLVEDRAADRIPDTILFLEHEPVITRGRGLQFTGVPRERHMPVPAQLPPGIAFSESERGGDLTYHGPGQLVIYPICKLDGLGLAPRHDVSGMIQLLEKVLIQELSHWDLTGEARAGATGVWVGERKVASIGIAVRKWVTYHGAALNYVNDLAPFQLISPCGFSSDVMTSVKDLAPAADQVEWRGRLEQRLAASFGEKKSDSRALTTARPLSDNSRIRQ